MIETANNQRACATLYGDLLVNVRYIITLYLEKNAPKQIKPNNMCEKVTIDRINTDIRSIHKSSKLSKIIYKKVK